MEEIYKAGESFMKQLHDSSLPLLSHGSPEIPESALLAANLARSISALPPHKKLPSTSESILLNSLSMSHFSSSPLEDGNAEKNVEIVNDCFYEENFDPVRYLMDHLPEEDMNLENLGVQSGKKLLQLDHVTESLSQQVMQHHEEMVKGMKLVMELEKDLRLVSIICKNARRFLSSATHEVTKDLIVTENVKKKQVLSSMVPILFRMQHIIDTKSRLEHNLEEGNYAKALRMCSECLVMIEECSHLNSIQDMNSSIEEWLTRTVEKVDNLLHQSCKLFDSESYAMVIDAYAVMDDADKMAEKVHNFFTQSVVSDTSDVLKSFINQNESIEDSSTQRKTRLPYNELCLSLSENNYRSCLQSTLSILFDIMTSYYTMMTWNHPKVELENEKESFKSPLNRILSNHKRPPLSSSMLSPATSFDSFLSPSKNTHSSPSPSPSPSSSLITSHLTTPASETSSSLAPSPSLPSPSPPMQSTPSHVSDSNQNESNQNQNQIPSNEVIPLKIENILSYSHSLPSSPSVSRVNSNLSEVGRTDYLPKSMANKMRFETTEVVRKTLEKGRKTVWEIAARRISSLLSCDAICTTSTHRFLQTLNWINCFILAGESFSGAEAVGLRTKMSKQSEKYFKSFHRQNLEVLRMMFEREQWHRLPNSVLKTINVKGSTITESSFSPSASSSLSPLSPSSSLSPFSSMEAKLSFQDWIEKGNPFSNSNNEEEEGEKDSDSTMESDSSISNQSKSMSKSNIVKSNKYTPVLRSTSERQPPEDKVMKIEPVLPKPKPKPYSEVWNSNGSLRRIVSDNASSALMLKSSSRGGEGEGEGNDEAEEEEAESEELMADYIDEDNQKPSHGKKNFVSRSVSALGSIREVGNGGEVEEEGPTLTGSVISVMRFMDRYVRLMQLLHPISPLVFKGLCQLFDLYFLTIFRIFGNREAFLAIRSQNDIPSSSLLTPRLQTTLLRISQGLEEYRSKNSIQPSPSIPFSSSSSFSSFTSSSVLSSFSTLSPLTEIGSPNSKNQSNLTSVSSNTYRIKERRVAMDSVFWLGEMMKHWKTRFHSLLPPSSISSMEHFYSRTIDAISDLGEHVHRVSVRQILNLNNFPERIGNAKWDTKDLGMEHNQYVDQLISEFKMFVHRLSHSNISEEAHERLVDYGVDYLTEILLDGFSRVKKCTNEGRALMSLDLQVLINGIQTVTRVKPTMQIVDNYIKAFYLPETEYLHWARTHPEYSKSQVLSLIHLVALTSNWKRKSKTDLIEKIESGT